jgi:hypothetical protein
MGNYMIWIGADRDGTPLIGSRACGDYEAVVHEHIYPVQMRHRVVVRAEDGQIAITTPTDARERGLDVIAQFPRADGSLSAR